MWRSTCFFLVLLLIMPIAMSQSENEAEVRLVAKTLGTVNIRNGPGTGYDVLMLLSDNTDVILIGRNQSSTWLLIDAENTQGWVSYTYVEVAGDVRELPVATLPSLNAATDQDIQTNSPENTETQQLSSSSQSTRQIFEHGQLLGNRADVFVKVGDSITASDFFLDQIGYGVYDLAEYAYLEGTINHFSRVSLNGENSFSRTSLAARSGWTAGDVLNPTNSRLAVCLPQETPLVCEYRLNRPAIALIMFGTNDIGYVPLERYEANLIRIVEISIDMGVIPVLSTIPDRFDLYNSSRVDDFNQVIRAITTQYNIPLWDFWSALQDLPNLGISNDGIHPSINPSNIATGIFSESNLQYGYNMRNLTALMMLDMIWREVIFPDAQ